MIKRSLYLEKIIPFIDKDVVKVITGLRRSGKSVFLKQVEEYLINSKRDKKQMISLNFEDFTNEALKDIHVLHNYLSTRIKNSSNQKSYLFFDEIQEVPNFERVINSLRVEYNVDIYLTGSNANLLSGELATYLAGRYIEFKMYPFRFKEYVEAKQQITKSNLATRDLFDQYLVEGGMPFVAAENFTRNNQMTYLLDIYNSVILKDVLQRNKLRDSILLEKVFLYVLANIGRTFSATSIAKYLKNERIKTTPETILNYINFGVEAFLIIPLRRYDLEGKKLLSTQEKYYVVDNGLRQAVIGRAEQDPELILENIVLMELLARGYQVHVGKLNEYEVDFIATKSAEKIYIQVSYLLTTEETREREFGILEKINDNYPKILLTLDPLTSTRNGIEHVKIHDFLLDISEN